MAQQTGAIYHQGILYSGGSGTNVTPNPQGEATDTLNTVEIDGTVYGIEGGSGSSLILDAQKYSLEEQVVGVWTDGKPLYQKTVHLSTLPSTANTYTTYSHGIQNIDTICGWDSVARWNTGTIRRIPSTQYVNNSQNIVGCFDVNITKTGIEIWVGQDRTALNSDFTIWYTKTTDTAGSGGYQAYGFSPIIYSDVEREVGVWRDNKPLYQKTWTFSSSVSLSANTWFTSSIPNTDMEKIINAEAISETGTRWAVSGACDEGSYVNLICFRNNAITVKYITLQYTKTTDVAGSGEYNTLAIPNVHYSTDEQVIGTWIDGKTLYQTVVEVSGTNIDIRNETYVNVIGVLPTNVSRYIKGELVTYDAGSSLTIGVFGGVLVKGINTSQNKILLYNVSVGQHIEMPQSENYVILQYTKTTD